LLGTLIAGAISGFTLAVQLYTDFVVVVLLLRSTLWRFSVSVTGGSFMFDSYSGRGCKRRIGVWCGLIYIQSYCIPIRSYGYSKEFPEFHTIIARLGRLWAEDV
jgi:hypothetical protein